MRLCPIPLFYCDDFEKAIHYAGESSRTTHGNELCIESCQYFCALILLALSGASKEELSNQSLYKPNTEEIANISKSHYLSKSYEQLTGSGYVVESLESTLWCFYHGSCFRESILLATNVGNDADTTAAICRQITGAYYGINGIPTDWRETITLSKEIHGIGSKLVGDTKKLNICEFIR